jgi:hypothetical protein
VGAGFGAHLRPLASSVCAAALLCGCRGSPDAFGPTAPANAAASRADRGECPLAQCIVVSNPIQIAARSSVLFFPRRANGNERPAGKIAGSETRLHYVRGIAMDAQGQVYVANNYPSSITVYAAGALGNVAPVRRIKGRHTQLARPAGIALDPAGFLYVVNKNAPSIAVYAPGATGDAAPVRLIRGAHTGLNLPWGIALDSDGNAYVANLNYPTSVTVYAAGADGDAAPIRTIGGANTKLTIATGVALDSRGYLSVADPNSEIVAVFAPGADGDVAPVRVVSSHLYGARNVAFDDRGRIYVVNSGYDDPPFVSVYGARAGSDDGFLREIVGKKTELFEAQGILVR